jgi:hypothetical protein
LAEMSKESVIFGMLKDIVSISFGVNILLLWQWMLLFISDKKK